MNTVEQVVSPNTGWTEITAAVTAGLFSVGTSCNFAISDAGVPAATLKGHGMSANEPRRYNLPAGAKLYVLARGISVYVVVTED